MKKLIYTALSAFAAFFAGAQVTPSTQVYPNSTTQALNPIPSAYAGTIALNYIRTWDAEKPFAADTMLSSTARTVQEAKQATQYVDGLGRVLQTVAKGTSPNGYDMVSPVVYDNFGREVYKYLPYTSPTSNGNFKTSPFSEQSSFMSAFYNPTANSSGEKFFYGKTVFEASPLNRPTNTYPAGNSWAGSAVGTSMQYAVSTAADSVVVWRIAYTQGVTPTSSGYYPYGQLLKNVTVDERGNSVVEYKDKDGHAILKKVQISATPYSGHTGWLCTYYIYDDLGNLRFVIQPAGTDYLRTHSWAFDAGTCAASTVAREQCFSCEYDQRNRVAIKRVPGAGEEWLVYDARDRVVMTQDSSLRAQGKWFYTDYDSLDRAVLTGVWASSGNLGYQQGQAYTSVTYPTPTSGYTVLTQTYYDDYSWVSGSGSGLSSSVITTYNSNTAYFATADDNNFPYPRALTATNLTHGKATGTKANVINTTTYLYSVNFYDDRARVIETQSTNYTGGIDTSITQYSFNNSVLNMLVCHGKGGTNPQGYKVVTKTTYDAAGRVTKTTQKTGNSPTVILAQDNYDELGQPLKKSIGQVRKSLTDTTYAGSPIDSLLYTYNIRGWLKGINQVFANTTPSQYGGLPGGWFGMELDYDYGFGQSYLNGNIAGIKWRSGGDGQQYAYGFTYDAANRLTKADFTQCTPWYGTAPPGYSTAAGIDFSVHSIGYDLNGNILTMNQMGVKLNTSVLIDSLLYGYNTNSNRLNYVTDRANDTTAHLGDFTEINNNTTQDYYWDGNGNLTQDNNKNISLIHYNYLNLPDSIRIKGKGYIKYVYNAAGIKLQKITTDSTTGAVKTTRTDYAAAFVYQNDTLQYAGTGEGRVRPKTPNRSDTMYYDYFEKDHLGNTRVVLTDERQQDVYPAATLESNANAFATEKSFYNIKPADTIGVGRIASWGSTAGRPTYNNNGNPPYNNNPYAVTTDSSKVVYRLNAQTGDTTGLGVTLRVMTGDAIDIYLKSFYHLNTGQTPNNSYSLTAATALSSFVNSLAGTAAVSSAVKGASTALNNPTTTAGISNWLSTVPPSTYTVSGGGGTLQASLNWILFDEHFNMVRSGSGFDFLSTTPDNIKSHHVTVTAVQCGYLYVYCSNQSNIDVFFDNLQVIDTRGPLLETDSYYPFGLTMAGISSQAAGKLENLHKYNKGSELQHKEFSDGSGLEFYATEFRSLDPQVGRWWQVDPKIENGQESMSPYTSMADNPILFNDPLGDTPGDSTKKTTPDVTPAPAVPAKPTLQEMKKNPPNVPGYVPPKSGARKVNHPRGKGWIDRNGHVWIPDDHNGTHAPHYDVQPPKGPGYETVYPSVSTGGFFSKLLASMKTTWNLIRNSDPISSPAATQQGVNIVVKNAPAIATGVTVVVSAVDPELAPVVSQ